MTNLTSTDPVCPIHPRQLAKQCKFRQPLKREVKMLFLTRKNVRLPVSGLNGVLTRKEPGQRMVVQSAPGFGCGVHTTSNKPHQGTRHSRVRFKWTEQGWWDCTLTNSFAIPINWINYFKRVRGENKTPYWLCGMFTCGLVSGEFDFLLGVHSQPKHYSVWTQATVNTGTVGIQYQTIGPIRQNCPDRMSHLAAPFRFLFFLFIYFFKFCILGQTSHGISYHSWLEDAIRWKDWGVQDRDFAHQRTAHLAT